MNPFSDRPAATISALGEIALLNLIREWLGETSPPPPQGMGDDCAVLDTRKADYILAKTDGVVYGRHFDDSTDPAAVGAKLLKRNLSDIAAMGGRPEHVLIHLLLGKNLSVAWLEKFYAGLVETCRKYEVTLAGGGTAQGPDSVLAADLTLLGVPGQNILLRAGVQTGDTLFVTGELGGSILGKHLDFTPRLIEGQWLAQQPGVRGVIDITDGLAKDLPAILPPTADARIDTANLPIADAARTLAARDGQSALLHALTDGEDYELLFAVADSVDAKAFAAQWRQSLKTPLTRIGVVALTQDATQGRQLRDAATGKPLLPSGNHGYEHFQS